MQIKVKDTRMHQVTKQVMLGTQPTRVEEIPVAEAELVLVKEFQDSYSLKRQLASGALKPILISRTEKIEDGDWFLLNNKSLQIAGRNGVKNFQEVIDEGINKLYKVLALPEHFSSKHLQAIVDGKMKEGDKVLVECEEKEEKDRVGGVEFYSDDEVEVSYGFYNFIKLNSSNHITLHKKEEKVYTREDFNVFVNWLDENWRRGKRGWYHVGDFYRNSKPIKTKDLANKWFEQNVK